MEKKWMQGAFLFTAGKRLCINFSGRGAGSALVYIAARGDKDCPDCGHRYMHITPVTA